MSETREPNDWYFVCDCGAKFFHAEQTIDCPRCGERRVASERLTPPWKKLLTVKEAASVLSISPSSLYDMASKGEITHRRVRGSLRFALEDIDDYLQACKREKREAGQDRSIRRPPRPRLKHIRL